jgi:ABC-2 type transport system ATP-binding protein
MTPAIEVRDLIVRFGDRNVVDGLNLTIPPGCIYALLGGNGAGKTTTINALLGFLTPEHGEVRIGGATPERNTRELAYLPENVALFPYLTGIENLRYFCALADVSISNAEAQQLLTRIGLAAESIHRRAATYSKGMRQKVGLCIAYARRCRAMLLDEPTSGLDPDAADDFAGRVRELGSSGTAVLIATHDLFNAKQVADRIGIMKSGRIVAELDAREIGHEALQELYLAHVRRAA